jgi:hypothetical protein
VNSASLQVLERSGSNEAVVYDQKTLSMQLGQLISSLREALPHLTTNDPVQSKPQNSQVYQGEAIISSVMIKNSIITIKKPPWLWSTSELCRPSDRRFLAK